MGLAVVVGMLADLLENDPEGADWLRGSFNSVNALLAQKELPAHHEPKSLPPLDNRASILSYPYSFLHHRRRVAAHAAEKPGWVAKSFDDSPEEQPTLWLTSTRRTCRVTCSAIPTARGSTCQ